MLLYKSDAQQINPTRSKQILKIRYFRTTPQQADGVFARKFLPKAAKPQIF
ncbi:MAG: hypothetical protein M3R14_02540 [Acidobacteriota bacterium]|nr:hypothetical protein [Acidobacteriota bacterium]